MDRATTGSPPGAPDDDIEPVVLAVPFSGRWAVQNSPANRVPSHGSNLFGTRFAIDFVAVDERGHSARQRDWRTWFGTEPPERFHAFGRVVTAPVTGLVIHVHDGEPDHAARRSPLTLVPYLLGQAARARAGHAALAGNHVVIGVPGRGAVVALVHLRRGSLRVSVGEEVQLGRPIGECGNSGNSTQPHVHLQVSDHADSASARGLPLAFAAFRQWTGRRRRPVLRRFAVPPNGAVIERWTDASSAPADGWSARGQQA